MDIVRAAAAHSSVIAILLFIAGCSTQSPTALKITNGAFLPSQDFDVPRLLALYQKNNQQEEPVVSYMIYGEPQLLVYPDGKVLTKASKEKSPSRLMLAHVSTNEVTAILASIASQPGIESLSNRYQLSRWSERPLHTIKVRWADRPTKSISVYGDVERPFPEDAAAPPPFLSLRGLLLSIQPKPSAPFDPGYVEMGFADYSYAPDPSVPWPTNWPSLGSPLVRETRRFVTEKRMIFPSGRLEELDGFLKKRHPMGAILIDGWKVSGSYRWPLPGEKQWTSWNQ